MLIEIAFFYGSVKKNEQRHDIWISIQSNFIHDNLQSFRKDSTAKLILTIKLTCFLFKRLLFLCKRKMYTTQQ